MNEDLFFKVWRNKFLNCQIFSKFKYNKVKNYKDVFGIDKIFNSYTNAIEIIFDKMKCNDYFIRNENDLLILFNKLSSKNQLNIYQFYNQLFQKYSTKSNFINLSKVKKWLPIILQSNNILLLNLYIQYFKVNEETMKSFTDQINNQSLNYYKIKMIHHLKINNYLNQDNSVLDNIPIKEIYEKLLLDTLKVSQFNKLFNIALALLKSKVDLNGDNKIINLLNKYQEIEKDGKVINKGLQKITIKKFLIKNSNSNQLIYYQFKIIFTIFKKYFNIEKPIQYYLYFKDKLKIETIFKKRNIQEIDWFLELFKITHQRNKKEQLNLISLFISNYQNKLDYHFLKIILSTNDTKLIGRFYQDFPIHNVYTHFKSSIFINIKSKDILDYYYQHHKELIFCDLNQHWQYFKSIEMLEYYELLMSSLSRKFLVSKCSFKTSKIVLELLNRTIQVNNESVINGIPTIYNIEPFDIDSYKLEITNSLESLNGQDLLIELFSKFYFQNFQISNYLSKNPIKVIHWLFNFMKKEFILNAVKQVYKDNNSFESQNIGNQFLKIFIFKITIFEKNFNNFQIQIFKNLEDSLAENKVQEQESSSSSIIVQMENQELLRYLGYCNRMDEIYQLYNSYPSVFLHGSLFNLRPFEDCHLNYCSIYQLESFISQCLNHSEEEGSLKKYLFYTLCLASGKGYIQIFKNLYQYYPDILTTETFKENFLIILIRISVDLGNELLGFLFSKIIKLDENYSKTLKQLLKKKLPIGEP